MIGAITAGLLSGAGAPASTTSYESIATVNVGLLGSTSIDFTSIPSTFKHLQIRAIIRGGGVGTGGADEAFIRFNSDATTSYSYHLIQGNGATASGGGSTVSATYGLVGFATRDGYATNTYTAQIIDILDYQNTNKYKTIRTLRGLDTNGAGLVSLVSSSWQKTSAVSSISIIPEANSFKQYSSFALYGIKG